MLVLHLGTQTLKLLEHLSGGTQPLFIEVELHGVVIELTRFVIAAQRHQRLHGQRFPVCQRIDFRGQRTELFQLEVVLVLPQHGSAMFHTGAEQRLQPPRLLRNPDHRRLVRQKLAGIPVCRFLIQRDFDLRILLGFGLMAEPFKFRRVLDQRNRFRPEKHAFTLLDVVDRRQPRLLQLLFRIIDDALQGMVHIRHVPLFKQQFLQAVPGYAVGAVMNQNLQKGRQLRLARLGAAGDQLPVPAHGEAAEHSHIQDILFGLCHPHFLFLFAIMSLSVCCRTQRLSRFTMFS